MQYILLAAAPGIAICVFIIYSDIYNKEPKFQLFFSFFLGCLAILPAIVFETSLDSVRDGTLSGVAIFAYMVVAFSEESGKYLGLRFYSYRQKSFDEPFDGIVYAVMVSMGFATVENIMYVLQSAKLGNGLEIGLYRMFLSVPAHGTFAVVMGYFVGKAKFDPKNSFMLMLMGLLGAIFFHGTFDFFLFASQTPMVGEQTGNNLLAGGAFVSFIVSLVLCRKLIRRQRNISAEMFKEKSKTTSV